MKNVYIKKFIISFLVSFLFFSCPVETIKKPKLIECPELIAKIALEYAYKYSSEDTEYEWGGRDPLRSIKIDCSGLVFKCYDYAVSSTEYLLPFQNATVSTLFNEWSVATDNPRPGDLIFMGDNNSNPTHISLYIKNDGTNIYFIDASLKPEDNINGVSERFYKIDDYRFLSFGKLLIQRK